MKRWTVMLIPHDRGNRREFELSATHLWGIVGIMAVAMFLSGFFHQRSLAAQSLAQDLQAQFELFEQTPAPPPRIVYRTPEEERAAIEARVRAEYEARDARLTAELGRVYDLESELRRMTGLPPRDEEEGIVVDKDGGKGGGAPLDHAELIADHAEVSFRPAHMIYGLSRPSADLIVQEMNLRRNSLEQLMFAMHRKDDEIARVPSVIPALDVHRRITSGFGNRRDPFTRRVKFHGGIDIGARHGTNIQATAKGVVVESDRDPYYGHYVRIDHGNGYETLYAHMSQRLVAPGDEIERGDVIGKVGSTGRSTSPHVHYEVFENGRRVNPSKFMGL